MASACVNIVGMPLDSFLECPPVYPSYNWLAPRISFSCEITDNDGSKDVEKPESDSSKMNPSWKSETEGMVVNDSLDFEFRLDDPVSTMLPADKLFYDGKLVPLQIAPARAKAEGASNGPGNSTEMIKSRRGVEIAGSVDLREFSPKAPKCSSRWKELLGLKKAQSATLPHQKPSIPESSKFLKHFLLRKPKPSSHPDSLSLPLLREIDSESVIISSRRSLSSSSSCADHEDLSRPSLDFDKQNHAHISPTPQFLNLPPVRLAKVTSAAAEGQATARVGRSLIRRVPVSGELLPRRGSSVDSPRLNASGKVIFQGLERSSSSPSSFNGGPRPRPRGMERSYSPNLRITPVLNVPICTIRGSVKSVSIFGFGQIFSPQKKEKEGYTSAAKKICNSSTSNGVTVGSRA